MIMGRIRRNRWLDRAWVAGLGVCCGLLISANCKWTPSSNAGDRSGPAPASAPSDLRLPPPPAGKGGVAVGTFESPFVAVAERVQEAVVNVNTRKTFEHPPIPGWGDDPLRDLLPEMDGPMDVPSSASGFVFDERGYVITNNHVIQDAEEVMVTFMDGREFAADVVGVDPSTDVAVLRIEGGEPFPVLPLGDSERIRVGDWAIAVGNPFGYLQGTVTVGVISAKGRADLDIAGGTPVYQNFIQTDASINFGNSGGPLVDIHGEVIGVNTAINPSGQGIGFAIPINLAKRIAGELIASGRVIRAYLGVYPQELTPEIVEAKGLGSIRGILVGQVVPGAPAERGGLERGDVILSFDGVETGDVARFRMVVADSEVGTDVEMVYMRDGERRTATVRLAERPDVAAAAERPGPEESWLGLNVVEPAEEPDAVRALGLEGEAGVLVSGVERGSPAWRAGLRAGDLIQEIDDRVVDGLGGYGDARRALRNREDPIMFLVLRGGFTQYLAVRP
ncbi:MAG: trypsin-like peptidase domain-containing protein [Candidatus Eisenbacteria bacterium]